MKYLGHALLISVLVLIVLTSAWVSRRALRAPYLNNRQKTIVVAVAWGLPIIGPALAFSVLGDHGIRKRGSRITLLELAFLSVLLGQETKDSRLEEPSTRTTPGEQSDADNR